MTFLAPTRMVLRVQMASPLFFTKKFWGTIKTDFMNIVRGFENDNVNIARLNYVMLTLIPKEAEATDLKKFRPIALINCSFKIILKL